MVRRVKVEFKKRLRQVLSLNDTPESIARSVAIGIFVAWTPTIGLQMLITFLLCCVARCNRIAGPLMAWLTNPVTILPIFWVNYLVGSLIVPSKWSGAESYSILQQAVERMSKIGLTDFIFFNWEKIKEWSEGMLSLGAEILVPLTIGSMLVGAVLGLISYPLTIRGVIAFRARRLNRGEAWAAYASGVGHPPAATPRTSEGLKELEQGAQLDGPAQAPGAAPKQDAPPPPKPESESGEGTAAE